MLPKAHLTSDSGMSGSRWVITPLWLSGSWRSFLYSSVYSCYLFKKYLLLLLGPYHFCPLLCPIFAWNVPFISLIFLKRSLVFPILLFSSVSLHWSLSKAFLSLLAILWNSAFRWIYLSFSPLTLLLFFSQLFVRPPQTTILHFFFLGMVLITASWALQGLVMQGRCAQGSNLRRHSLSGWCKWVSFLKASGQPWACCASLNTAHPRCLAYFTPVLSSNCQLIMLCWAHKTLTVLFLLLSPEWSCLLDPPVCPVNIYVSICLSRLCSRVSSWMLATPIFTSRRTWHGPMFVCPSSNFKIFEERGDVIFVFLAP